MVVLPHPSPPLWIPAFAGMTKWGGRNDEVGGRNDDGGGPACCPWWVVGWGVASPLTAPLDSGLRRNDEVGGRNDGVGGRNDDGGGRPAVRGSWLDGVLPHPSPPLWIPAFAGMTEVGGRNDEMGRRNDEWWGPACCPWLVVGDDGVASPLTAPLDSGLRRNDDGCSGSGVR